MEHHPISEDWALPKLREDLQVMPGTPTPEGHPTWNIFDPVRDRFFQIGWTAFQLLTHWNAGTVSRVIFDLHNHTTARVSSQEVREFIGFLYQNNLTQDPPADGGPGLWRQAEQAKRHWMVNMLHHYLFFRIPLWNPDEFLQQTQSLVAPFFTGYAKGLVLLLGFFGLVGVSFQWERFQSTFLYFFSFEGFMMFGLGLIGTKALHELGHAYTAKFYGCRVHTMGIGFLLLFPVLFTDTTDSWKLPSRRQRAMIAAAGTLVELSLAMVATFLWNVCPDGILSSLLFVVATTNWVSGLLINMNPCLRFDGYYVLSDWWGVPNLQARAFALGRWQMRQWLFGFRDQPPEHFSAVRHRAMIGYAWVTWLFRAVMFVGIALLVYQYCFKVLGILLFFVEIGWFIVQPLYQELGVWWKRRTDIWETWHGRVVASGLFMLIVSAGFPLDTTVMMPAILEAKQRTMVYPPVSAQLMESHIQEGDRVQKDDILFVLDSPSLNYQIEVLTRRMVALEGHLNREAAYGHDREHHEILWQSLQGKREEMQGLQDLQAQLTVRAPFSGKVTDLAPSLRAGRWVKKDEALAHCIDESGAVVQAFTGEDDHGRLQVGSTGWFYPNDATRARRRTTLREIHHVHENHLTLPYMASTFSGDIPVREDEEGRLIPEHSIYRIELNVEDDLLDWNQVVPGIMRVQGASKSLGGRLWASMWAILIRESGV